MFCQEDNIPEGWYEKNRIAYLQPYRDVYIYRIEDRSGKLFGLIRYFISVDGVEALIPETFFIRLSAKYTIHYVVEYKYLEEDGKTKYLYSSNKNLN